MDDWNMLIRRQGRPIIFFENASLVS
jgi:hypothetical protein